MTLPRYEDEGMIWSTPLSETAPLKLVEADPCLCAVTYLDGKYKEENVEMVAWKTVKGSYRPVFSCSDLSKPMVFIPRCLHS